MTRVATMIALLLAATVAAGPLTAQAAPAQTLIVVVDISESAPLAFDPVMAQDAGAFVEAAVGRMNSGDTVRLRSLGTDGLSSGQIRIDVDLVQKYRPHLAAPLLGGLIGSLPERVARGEVKPQPTSAIVSFLEATGSGLDCRARPTRIVLFTDGIEWSTHLTGRELLAGTKRLPAPSGPILQGCMVEMRGIGQQRSGLRSDGRWLPVLRSEWSRFMTSAGVASFKALAPLNE